jgi:hypothetical protein
MLGFGMGGSSGVGGFELGSSETITTSNLRAEA